MVDDGSVFLGRITSETTLIRVWQKQGQYCIIRLGVSGCVAEHVIIGVTRFVVCFGSVQILL